MRTWKIADQLIYCGAAADCAVMPKQPYLELRDPKWGPNTRKIRCSQHADEAVPAVIEGHKVPAPAPVSLRQLAVVFRRDPKMRQANDGHD